MDSRKFIIQKTLVLLAGQVICVAGMCGVFALLGWFDSKVVFGGVVGGLLHQSLAIVADHLLGAVGYQGIGGDLRLLCDGHLFVLQRDPAPILIGADAADLGVAHGDHIPCRQGQGQPLAGAGAGDLVLLGGVLVDEQIVKIGLAGDPVV